MRCVSYTRFISSLPEKETPPDIINQQNLRISAYAKKHGWKIGKKYSDRQESRNARRAFDDLLEDGMSREFELLVIDSYYRLGQNVANARNMLAEVFYPAGIDFAVVEDDFCSIGKTPEEVERYIAEKNSDYRIQIRWMAHNSDREKGLFSVHDEKYGYLISEDRRSLVIDEEVAPVIREIFELMAGGDMTMKQISEVMDEKGFECPAVHLERVTRKHTKAKGYLWTPDAIKRVLFCTDYYGIIKRKINGEYVEIEIPAIITKELFDKAEAVRISHRTGYHSKIKQKKNALRFIIKSAETGGPMVCKEVGPDRERRFCRIRKTKGDSVPYDKVVGEVTELLKKEKALALRVSTLLDGENAAAEMNYRKQKVIDAMVGIIDEMAAITDQRTLISEETGASESDAALEELDRRISEQEQMMAQRQEELLEIIKCFQKNPWVELYSNIDIPEHLDNATARKWIEMVWVHDLEEVTMDVKHEEWKRMLPTEWFEEADTDGEEKQEDKQES